MADDTDRHVARARPAGSGERAQVGGSGTDLWSSVRETVAAVDVTSGRVVDASPSWASYGHGPAQLLDRDVLEFVHPDDHPLLQAYLERPELAQDEPSVPARMRCGDGSWLSAAVRVQCNVPLDGPVVLTFLPMDEITAATLERERRAADQLRVIDEMKHQLLEAVSHQLRTPLTVVAGFAETLQRRDMAFEPAELEEIGASIERHASRLEAIVTDLVDLDSGTRGELAADRAPADLSAIVRQALVEVPLGARPLRLDLTPVVVPLDHDRILRVVGCLLDNVRRHTPPDTSVVVRVAPEDDGALLEVTDDGPGLSAAVRDQVFSPFAQGRLRQAASPGLGLGLALVRRFTELHGGRCWYSAPEDGAGARFSVHLPGAARAGEPEDRLGEHLSTARAREQAAARATGDEELLSPDAQRTVGAMLQAVRRELDVDVVYLSTFTTTEQLVVATAGDGGPLGLAAGRRIPLEDAYCVRMVRGEVGNVVRDTRADPVLAPLPPTADGIGAYLGVPVRRPDGHLLGSLCCAHGSSRDDLGEDHVTVLRTLAGLLGEELAHHMAAGAEDRATSERIRAVLDAPDGIRMAYQPIVDLHTGDVVGVEALARFHDSGLRPPDVWFADAARVGLGGPLERSALLHGLEGLRDLPTDVHLAVNLSPGAIGGDGLRRLLDDVPLERVVIEVTEHAAVEDYDRLDAMLRPLRAAGARLAIDDVGAGFSSLRHVLQLDPDIIKLDRSLVSRVAVDPAQQAIAVALAQLAERLGDRLVAEGIEDAATLRALVDAGVTHGQGWFFDRAGPLPLRTRRYPVG